MRANRPSDGMCTGDVVGKLNQGASVKFVPRVINKASINFELAQIIQCSFIHSSSVRLGLCGSTMPYCHASYRICTLECFCLNICDGFNQHQVKCMSFIVRQDDLLWNPVYKKLGAINAVAAQRCTAPVFSENCARHPLEAKTKRFHSNNSDCNQTLLDLRLQPFAVSCGELIAGRG